MAYGDSLSLHKKLRGKIFIGTKKIIRNAKDLSLLYTPGVADVARAITRNPSLIYDMTMKWNSVAIVTDGTRTLGLGKTGPEAALPVMEGKALLMKQFANIDAFPLCLKCTEIDKIVELVKNIEPVFGAINLEDIETPKVFEIEERLTNELSIPVFHDDQHGTAIVVLAALINALRFVEKEKEKTRIAIVGAGGAGYGITKLLVAYGIKNIVVFDNKGAIWNGRNDLPKHKQHIAELTNKEQFKGSVVEFKNADAIISAAAPGAIPLEAIENMNEPKIVFALANPVSEISPEDAKKLGIEIFGTGRSDLPNQINNVLCFPGFLRALLDLRIRRITDNMKIAAAEAIAGCVSEKEVKKGKVVPHVFDKHVVPKIVDYIKNDSRGVTL